MKRIITQQTSKTFTRPSLRHYSGYKRKHLLFDIGGTIFDYRCNTLLKCLTKSINISLDSECYDFRITTTDLIPEMGMSKTMHVKTVLNRHLGFHVKPHLIQEILFNFNQSLIENYTMNFDSHLLLEREVFELFKYFHVSFVTGFNKEITDVIIQRLMKKFDFKPYAICTSSSYNRSSHSDMSEFMKSNQINGDMYFDDTLEGQRTMKNLTKQRFGITDSSALMHTMTNRELKNKFESEKVNPIDVGDIYNTIEDQLIKSSYSQ